MYNLLMAVFRGKFTEAVDLGEKEKLEIPGGWVGVQRPSGGRGSKVKNLPGGGGGGWYGYFLEPHNATLVPSPSIFRSFECYFTYY